VPVGGDSIEHSESLGRLTHHGFDAYQAVELMQALDIRRETSTILGVDLHLVVGESGLRRE
jgi:hypothetical protein